MIDMEEDEWITNHFLEIEQILTKGDELQKLSVIGSLPELLKFDKNGTVAKVLPKIQQELPNSSSEFSLAVSRMFNVLVHLDVPVNLIPQILQGIENKDPVIANAWMETLLSVIPVLKEAVIKSDILKCVNSKSQLSQNVYFRVSSCKILGKMAVHRSMNAFEVKKDVLPLVQSLCQDCFHEVRAAMCKELPNIAQGLYSLGDATVRVSLLPLLLELSNDENVIVRAISVEAVVNISPFLSADNIKSAIIPLIKKMCTRSVTEGDNTYTAVASVYGRLITNLQESLTANDAMWFLDYYTHICKKGLSLVEDLDTDPSICMLCRENCALTLPKMAQMILLDIPNEITNKWYNTFKALAADPCYIVRRAVANCLGEIVRILGNNNKIIMTDFCKLLRDEDEEVLQALVPNLALILDYLSNTGVLTRDVAVQYTLDIGRAMIKCQNEVFKTNNWRLKESILKQWERLPSCIPSDFIHQHFTPVVLAATVTGRAKPVRSQAARTLLIILRYSLKENHRKWIRENIHTQLCLSSCCYSRQIYVKLCKHAIDIFSLKYFKEFFYMPLLSLAEDSIAIVRLCMINLCPVLKQMLVLPVDRNLQLKLENILQKMEMMEQDKDVIRTLKLKLKEMRSASSRVDIMAEERRKIDEEDRVFKGKMPPIRTTPIQTSGAESLRDPEPKSPITVQRPKTSTSGTRAQKRLADGSSSNMSFLDQHFYIDAGVSLPNFDSSLNLDKETNSTLKLSRDVSGLIDSTENLTFKGGQSNSRTTFNDNEHNDDLNLEEKDMVISVENINIESLTERDLQALKTSTTNITDDIKVNLQKRSKEGEFRKRSKRHSYDFSSDIGSRSSSKTMEASLKRRSLNIPITIESKIPVTSNANKRLSYGQKSKSVSDQNLDISHTSSSKASALPRFNRSSLNLRFSDERMLNSVSFVTDNQKVSVSTSYKSDDEVIVKKRTQITDGNNASSRLANRQISAKNAKLDLEISLQNNNINDKSDNLHTRDYQSDSFGETAKTKEIRRRSSGLPVSIVRRSAK